MDYAYETKKKRPVFTENEQKSGNNEDSYPFRSYWSFLQQCQSIHPLLKKWEY